MWTAPETRRVVRFAQRKARLAADEKIDRSEIRISREITRVMCIEG